MDKVLVTGASGFVGRQCLAALANQAGEVHAVARTVEGLDVDGLHLHAVDLLDAQQVSALIKTVRPTHLLHLAWVTTPGVYWTSPQNLAWVESSFQLLRLFAEHGGRRAALAGSCAEYEWSGGCCDESATPLRPGSLYGVCKNALRERMEGFVRQTGLSTAWGRLFFLYGPHEHPRRLVASVCRALLTGTPAHCSAGAQQRDFLHVRDVAEGLVALLGSDVRGPVNVASGQAVAVREVVERIAAVIGTPELVQYSAVTTPVNEPPILFADVGRLRNEVSWSPRFNLDQGLAHTIDWWRSSIHGNSLAA